jgi:chorismate mutase/prephenate dehydratase
MKDLQQCRQEIDQIDRQLVKLFEERMHLAHDVARYKQQAGLPIHDPHREAAVLKERLAWLDDRSLSDKLIVLWQTLMDLNKEEQYVVPVKAQKSPALSVAAVAKAAYQGVPGAYSHQALINYFGEDFSSKACLDFDEVLAAVLSQKVGYGVLPVENSTTGSINQVYDILDNYPVTVIGEVLIPIRHQLLILPQAQLADIKTVYSHEQGFKQCQEFLSQYPAWQLIPHHNTALSAQYVKNAADPSQAAIASSYAGLYYGLAVAAQNIQDEDGNHTRFFVFAARDQAQKQGNKTTLSFRLTHLPGVLHRVLGCFAAGGYNLTHLESRPVRGSYFEYRFFVDLEGDFSAEKVENLQKELQPVVNFSRCLGIYEKAAAIYE